MAKVKETAQVISQEQLSDDIFSMWIHTEAIAFPGSCRPVYLCIFE